MPETQSLEQTDSFITYIKWGCIVFLIYSIYTVLNDREFINCFQSEMMSCKIIGGGDTVTCFLRFLFH